MGRGQICHKHIIQNGNNRSWVCGRVCEIERERGCQLHNNSTVMCGRVTAYLTIFNYQRGGVCVQVGQTSLLAYWPVCGCVNIIISDI